ncbi:MAG: 6,7-dimethyl-8-ribityllumazine synthase [Gaiellaceae bacterium]
MSTDGPFSSEQSVPEPAIPAPSVRPWPGETVQPPVSPPEPTPPEEPEVVADQQAEPPPLSSPPPAPDLEAIQLSPPLQQEPAPALAPDPEPAAAPAPIAAPPQAAEEHAGGELEIPQGYRVLEGGPSGAGRTVGIVVSRFNGAITSGLLQSALAELERLGVPADAVTVMPVPGAFELPLAAMALAKSRRYACVVALGCVIRGETPHFDYVAGEAASGLQLAGLETGIPVAFGVLTVDTVGQAQERLDKGAEAVRTALELADVFAKLRASAQSAG